MSSWSEIRSRTTDPLSSTINSLITRQNQANAITDEITDADTIFPVRILNSKLSLNDKNLTVGYSKPLSQAFYLPFEPDGDVVKLWTRFDSGGVNVVDYSGYGNNIEIRHDDSAPQPTLIMTAEDDGVAKNKISSFLQKTKKHYFRITDPQFQLSTENKSFSFFFKIFPYTIINVLEHGKRAVLLDYIENDQVSHAVRVELDDEGYLYFFVRWNYIDYFVKSGTPILTLPDLPDYYAEDYDPDDYYASTEEQDYSAVIDELETALSYIFCTFDKDTKVATILHPVVSDDEEENIVETWSSDPPPLSIPQPDNLSLWLPLSEGGGDIETVHDISGLVNHGSFSAITSARKPSWTTVEQTNVTRAALEFGPRDYLTIPRTTSLNTLTSFTFSTFMYLHSDYYTLAHSKIFFSTTTDFDNGSLLFYTPTGTDRQIALDLKTNAGVSRFLATGGTPLPTTTGQWVHIAITYDASVYKVYVDGVLVWTSSTFAGDVYTNTAVLSVGTIVDNAGGHSNMAHVMLWKNRALTLVEIEDLYDNIKPYLVDDIVADTLLDTSITMFPPAYNEPPEPPAPGTPITLPFTQTQYDQQTGTAFSAVKPVTISGLTEVYNVAGGAPTTDPVVLQYNVPEGVNTETTTSPQTIYNLGGNGSIVMLPEENDFAGQRVKSTSSVLYNQIITEITLRLSTTASSLSGEVRIGVIKSGGGFIQFGASIPGTELDNDVWKSYTRTHSTNNDALAVGDAIGIMWAGADDSTEDVEIESAGSGVHVENSSYSHFGYKEVDGTSTWTEDTNRSVAGIFKNKGGTAIVSPWVTINTSSQYIIGEIFSSGSTMNNKAATKVELKVKKKSGTTGTLNLQIVTNAGALKKTLKSWNIGTAPEITTSDPAAGVLNLVWEDLTNTTTITTSERLTLSGSGTLNLGGEVYVMSNLGNNTPTSDTAKNHNSTSSYIMKRNSTGSWSTYDNQIDITGKISTGGNDFTGYINLDGSRKRTGIKADTDTSSLKTKKITKVTATLKKFGTPAAGAIYCRIRNSAGTIRETINQTDISAISTSDTSVDFVNVTHNITLALDDTISIEYDLGDASNYVMVRVNKNQFEGVNTILFESLAATINTAAAVDDRDLAAILYTGGEIDTSARPRVGLSVNNSNSSLWGEAITKIRLWLKREGSTFGAEDEISVKVIRGSDKVVVSTLGTKVILDLTTSDIAYDFENTGNSYVMADGDMIVVENLFGNSTNYVWVKRSDTQVIDDTSTCLVDWNSTAYNLTTDQDLNATAWTGGYTVYPDPNIPTSPTPYHYSHEMFFGSATTPDSETLVLPSTLEPDPETMFDFIAADFRVYQGRLIDEEQALNLFRNKYTISALEFTEVNTVAHSIVSSG